MFKVRCLRDEQTVALIDHDWWEIPTQEVFQRVGTLVYKFQRLLGRRVLSKIASNDLSSGHHLKVIRTRVRQIVHCRERLRVNRCANALLIAEQPKIVVQIRQRDQSLGKLGQYFRQWVRSRLILRWPPYQWVCSTRKSNHCHVKETCKALLLAEKRLLKYLLRQADKVKSW